MKRLVICLFLVVVCGSFLTPVNSFAQTKTATPEQSLQQLVTEVRQLRATLQRMNAAVYRGQVMLERMKFQQEQVTRISRELRDAREALTDLRGQQSRMKEMLGRLEADVQAGHKDPAGEANLKAELAYVAEREQRMMLRESQLAGELEAERAKLNELNDKLNMLLEREL